MEPAIQTSQATYADLCAQPGDERWEILDGELLALPSALPEHGFLEGNLATILNGGYGRRGAPGGWWIVVECDIQIPRRSVCRPDLTGWRVERMPTLPKKLPVTLLPDWICEIVSPGAARRDRIRKADLYAQAGIPFYWIVDPQDRILEAFALRDGGWFRLGAWSDGDTARIAPFDELEINIDHVFPPEA